MSKPQPPNERVSPDYPDHLSSVPCPHTPADRNRCACRLLPCPVRPSPNLRRVGVRIFTFEACSGFTHVTARWIAQPPKAAFVARLRPGQSPNRAACQLPDQPTIIWMEPTSTGDPRRRGARRVEEGRGGVPSTLRLPSPLIKPDVRISRIRLSDWFHCESTRRCPRAMTPSFP